MTRQHPLARMFVQSDGGADGEGSWIVTVGEAKLVAIVQPWKDIPGEAWIARAWHPGLGAFLGGGGQDACDAALAVVEDYYWTISHLGHPRVAITYDPNVPRRHRADTIDQPFPAAHTTAKSAETLRCAILEVATAPAVESSTGTGEGPGVFDDDSFGGNDDDAFG